MHKIDRKEVERRQAIANTRLSQSRSALSGVQAAQVAIKEVLDRVRELNQENNFAPKLAAAYKGQS